MVGGGVQHLGPELGDELGDALGALDDPPAGLERHLAVPVGQQPVVGDPVELLERRRVGVPLQHRPAPAGHHVRIQALGLLRHDDAVRTDRVAGLRVRQGVGHAVQDPPGHPVRDGHLGLRRDRVGLIAASSPR